MPEGDTIWRAAAAMRPQLVGQIVVSARPGSVGRLAGSEVVGVDARGKHLTVRFSNGLALHTHMRMRGAWHLYPPGEPWRRPPHQARAVLECRGVVAVLFNAPVVEVVRDPEAPTAHLGPDILVDEWRASDAVERSRRAPAATLGELLLDQRVCAGIGNVYKCEALFVRGLNPWTAPAAVDDAELAALFETARAQMRHNLHGPFARRWPGVAGGTRGAAVHGRRGRPCLRCRTTIQARRQGEQARMTYWCPTCQPTRNTEETCDGA